MKIRNGFVSNSSSSSFIIAVDDVNDDLEIKLVIDITNEESKTLRTEGDVKDHLYLNTDYDWEEYEKELFKKYMTEINNGKVLKLYTCYSDGQDALSGLLGQSVKGLIKGGVVIEDNEN